MPQAAADQNAATVPATQRTQGDDWPNASQLINNTHTQNPAAVLLATARSAHSCLIADRLIHASYVQASSAHSRPIIHLLVHAADMQVLVLEPQAHSRLIALIYTRNETAHSFLIHTRIIGSFPPHHTLARSCRRHTGTRITGSFTPHRTYQTNAPDTRVLESTGSVTPHDTDYRDQRGSGETRSRHHLTGSALLIQSLCCWGVAPHASARCPTEPAVEPWPQSMQAAIITLPEESRG